MKEENINNPFHKIRRLSKLNKAEARMLCLTKEHVNYLNIDDNCSRVAVIPAKDNITGEKILKVFRLEEKNGEIDNV